MWHARNSNAIWYGCALTTSSADYSVSKCQIKHIELSRIQYSLLTSAQSVSHSWSWADACAWLSMPDAGTWCSSPNNVNAQSKCNKLLLREIKSICHELRGNKMGTIHLSFIFLHSFGQLCESPFDIDTVCFSSSCPVELRQSLSGQFTYYFVVVVVSLPDRTAVDIWSAVFMYVRLAFRIQMESKWMTFAARTTCTSVGSHDLPNDR